MWASEVEQLLWPFLAALPIAIKQSILDEKQQHCSIIEEEKQDNFLIKTILTAFVLHQMPQHICSPTILTKIFFLSLLLLLSFLDS